MKIQNKILAFKNHLNLTISDIGIFEICLKTLHWTLQFVFVLKYQIAAHIKQKYILQKKIQGNFTIITAATVCSIKFLYIWTN